MKRKKTGSRRTKRVKGNEPPMLKVPLYADSRIQVERLGENGPTGRVEVRTFGYGGGGGNYPPLKYEHLG